MQLAAASGKFGIARVGHVGRQIEQRLFAVAKMRGHDQLARFGQAEALADVLEAALHGERGGGEHDGGDGFEDQLAQQLRDIDGRGLQEMWCLACDRIPARLRRRRTVVRRSCGLPTMRRSSQ